jgi:formiminotetrahydrofolate cyclodeaminase
MKAYKSAKGSAEGGRLINVALKLATTVPLGVAGRAVEVAQIAAKLASVTNPNMKSDLTTAVALAGATLTGALANVEINLASIKVESPEDEAFVRQTQQRAEILKAQS